jgi:hypothetical protein
MELRKEDEDDDDDEPFWKVDGIGGRFNKLFWMDHGRTTIDESLRAKNRSESFSMFVR